MDKEYAEYTSKLENFLRSHSDKLTCKMKHANLEMYLNHFKEKADREDKFFGLVGTANMYDGKLLNKYSEKIVYLSHFIAEQGVRKFCGVIQFEENLHGIVSYGCLGEDGFVTPIDFYTTDPTKVVEFIDNNKDIEFLKDYQKNLGFGSRPKFPENYKP